MRLLCIRDSFFNRTCILRWRIRRNYTSDRCFGLRSMFPSRKPFTPIQLGCLESELLVSSLERIVVVLLKSDRGIVRRPILRFDVCARSRRWFRQVASSCLSLLHDQRASMLFDRYEEVEVLLSLAREDTDRNTRDISDKSTNTFPNWSPLVDQQASDATLPMADNCQSWELIGWAKLIFYVLQRGGHYSFDSNRSGVYIIYTQQYGYHT